MTDWFDNDDLFFEQLEKGHKWAKFVAAKVKRAGFDVVVTPMQRRATIGRRHDFQTEVDLRVGPVNPSTNQRAALEVKSRDLGFGDDPASYPYSTAFVDTVKGWEAKDPKPVAVVLVSQRTEAMLVVPPSTRLSWSRVRTWDRVRKINVESYAVNRDQLRSFADFAEWMGARWS